MPTCPHCHASISEEIFNFGGECGVCFKQVIVELGENADFESTGMFADDQFATEEQSVENTGEIELSELEVEDWDDTTEIIVEYSIDDIDTQQTDIDTQQIDIGTLHSIVEIYDEEPTMALTDHEILQVPQLTEIEDESVSQNLDDILHHEESELGNAEVIIPSISVPEESGFTALSTEERNMVYEEDSDESFLTDETQPRERVTSYRAGRRKRVQPKKQETSSIRMLVILSLFFLTVATYWFSKKPDQTFVTSTGQENLFVPNMPEVKVKEEEVTPKETKTVTRKSTKKKNSQPVQRGGDQTFQTAAPVMRTKMPTTGTTGSTTDKVEKDISKLRRNLKSCHDQVLKSDPLAAGKWQVKFKVSPAGKSSNISIKALRAKNSDIESCMTRRITRFKFHGPSSTTPYDFRIVFGG